MQHQTKVELKMENWKEIKNYEDYSVSNYGRVKSIRFPNRCLKPRNTHGYLHVILCKNGVHKNHKIHRLVALAFIPNPENKRTVNHIDGCKINNFAENLERNTHAENNKHEFDNGLKDAKGIKNGQAKLSEDQVLEIRKLYKTGEYSQRGLGKIFGVYRAAISKIVNRRNWKHI